MQISTELYDFASGFWSLYPESKNTSNTKHILLESLVIDTLHP